MKRRPIVVVMTLQNVFSVVIHDVMMMMIYTNIGLLTVVLLGPLFSN